MTKMYKWPGASNGTLVVDPINVADDGLDADTITRHRDEWRTRLRALETSCQIYRETRKAYPDRLLRDLEEARIELAWWDSQVSRSRG